MKHSKILLCLLFLLSGCSGSKDTMDTAMRLRAELLGATELRFRCSVIADYGDQIHTFKMDCFGNERGDIQFTVAEPESISGITGLIEEKGGKFTFDDKVLFFPLLVDNQLSPVCAPWIFLKALQSGYIRSVGKEDNFLRLTVDDTYADETLQMDVWITEEKSPVRADILYDGKRLLSLEIENFHIQ